MSTINDNDNTNAWSAVNNHRKKKVIDGLRSESPVDTARSAFSAPRPVEINNIKSEPSTYSWNGSITSTNNNFLETLLEIKKAEYAMLGKMIEQIKEEIKLPVFLRGKTDSDKEEIIFEKILGKINTITKEDNGKIINSIIQSNNIQNLISIIDDNTKLTNLINNTIKSITESDVIIEVATTPTIASTTASTTPVAPTIAPSVASTTVSSVAPTTIPSVASTTVPSVAPITIPTTTKVTKTFSGNHKTNLNKGQDEFFNEFSIDANTIKKIKEMIKSTKEKEILIKNINISNDKITIGDHSFSKKHYFSQKFFKTRVITYYRDIFDGKYIKVSDNDSDIITIKISL